MAPKLAAPGAVTDDELLESFMHAAEAGAEEASSQLVDELVASSFVQAHAAELDRKSGPFEVDRCLLQIGRTLRWYFVACDKGSDVRAASWQPDPEPVPAVIDAWSRGSVPGRPRERKSVSTPSRPGSAKPSMSGSRTSSRPSSGGSRRPTSAGALRPSNSMPALGAGGAASPGGRPQILTCKAPPGSVPPTPLGRGKRDAAAPPRGMGVNPILQQAAKLAAQLKADEQLELAMLEQLRKQLKDAPFTYAPDGRPIVLTPPNPAAMPALVNQPRLSVAEGRPSSAASSPPTSPARRSTMGRGSSSSLTGGAGVGGSGSPLSRPGSALGGGAAAAAGSSSSLARPASAQPLLQRKGSTRFSDGRVGWEYEPHSGEQPALNETIVLAPGVALETGTPAVRLSGGEAMQPPGRLSKVQFHSLVAMNEAEARAASAAASAARAAANAEAAPGSPARSLPRPSTAPATR